MAQLWRGQVVSGAAIWAAQNGDGTGATIVITGITPDETSIAVTWTGTATHYRINGGTATALPDGTSPDTITGLTANTEYDAPGLELGASSSGPWSDPVAFGTLNPGEGGGGIPFDVSPATGSIAVTGYAPTLARTANQSVQAGAGSVAVKGYAPTLAQSGDREVSPAAGSIAVTGYAPTIQQVDSSPTITPSAAGSIAVTGYAPTLTRTGSSLGFEEIIESGLTAAEMLRVIMAGVSGRTEGIGTAVERYYSIDGAKPRITATFDSNGNRTSVVIDGSP
jgi:hypothetical protein